MLSKLKSKYKNSKIFKLIDKAENKIFQKKLTNHDFTLLTPNCMGGLIYHRLGEKFNSPTINISMPTHDFMAFINDLDYYLSNDIYETDNAGYPYPIGVIYGDSEHDDVRVNFVHYKTFEQGKEKWNKRKTRVNKDNLYIIICDLDDIYEADYDKAGFINDEDISLFEQAECNNKIMLTRDKNRKQSYAHYIEPMYNKPYPLTYMNRDILGLNGFEKHFDFVSFLNKR
ncbi:MAG: DUF1919 domain-containing protein [Eubacteriales bacterium]|nr:DUF1919 domain-containing protein [Eubacteriales bacterium]